MSQNDQILHHLKSGQSITATQAISLFNCYRLAARIDELRKKGHLIETTTRKRDKKSWAVYKIEGKK